MFCRFLLPLLLAVGTSSGAQRVTLTGVVTDRGGKPLDNAMVMVYYAGVKQGYNAFCPSCYTDCGKRTTTNQTGSFTISNLDPDLFFELLVVRDGFAPRFLHKVDPSRGPARTAILLPRASVNDLDRVVRGRVVESHGLPVRSAVIEPEVLQTKDTSMLPTISGLEPLAVSNQNGDFELAYSEKATRMLVRVEARGLAAKTALLPTGAGRTTITVSDGAVIRGRLIKQGKPVPSAEIGLIPRTLGGVGPHLTLTGDFYREIRIGTQADGSFVIPNVPTHVDWYAYGRMESLAALGGTRTLECATRHDGEEIDLGNIDVEPGYHLRGTVKLDDGSPFAYGMRITISRTVGTDNLTVLIGRDGKFEFTNLAPGKYNILPSVQGYELPKKESWIETTISRDIDDFSLELNRVAPSPKSQQF